MSGKNGYAALVKQRSTGKVKRRKLDDYETPNENTRQLLKHVKFSGPIFEPACGSGRMMRELRSLTGLKVTGSDIKHGADFLKRTKTFPGDIVTNPPYRDGLAERFARHALKIADGRVCMLMQSGFLWGGKRGSGLYTEHKPEAVLIIPERIYFLVNGKPIESQFFSHAWICWPARKKRAWGGYDTQVIWVDPEEEF